MQQIADRIFLFTSVMQQLNTVVIIDDEHIILIDPGFFPQEIAEIQTFIRPWETPTRQRFMVITHSHFDHIAGVSYFPGYQLIVSEKWDRANEQRSRARLERFDGEFYVDRPWHGLLSPILSNQTVRDGQKIGPLLFFATPGHTQDSLSILYQDILIVGDYLSILEFPFINHATNDYETTLRLFLKIVADYPVRLLVSQHGHHAQTLAEIKQRVVVSQEYIRSVRRDVQNTIDQHLSAEYLTNKAASFEYLGGMISVGLVEAHRRNVLRIWSEYHEADPRTQNTAEINYINQPLQNT